MIEIRDLQKHVYPPDLNSDILDRIENFIDINNLDYDSSKLDIKEAFANEFEVDEEFDDGQLINFAHSINYINSDNKDVFSTSITIVENQYRYEVSSLNKELSSGSSGSSGSSLEDEMDTALSLELNNAITIQCKDDSDNIILPTLIFDGETCTPNNDTDYYIVENVDDGEHSISGGLDVTFHNSLQDAIDSVNSISTIMVSEEQRDFIIYRRVHDGR